MNIGNQSKIPAEELTKVLTQTDKLSVTSSGNLKIAGCLAKDLLARFGSPLYVVSEATLRENYRRVHRAFSELWPSPINVLYAIKANNNLAIRAIMNQEGAGGDCFGEGELHATFAGGAAPSKIVLNGSNKRPNLLRKAIEMGVAVNIDAEDELDYIIDFAEELNTTARAKIRLKVYTEKYNAVTSDYFGISHLADYVKRVKWGFSLDAAEKIIQRILDSPRIDFLGYHFHIGRSSSDILFTKTWSETLAEMASNLHQKTGYTPTVINVGGGWPRERDPESRSIQLNPTSIEEYASAACSNLLKGFEKAQLPIPELWLEPGRYIVGNAVVFLATVGAVKNDMGFTWVNLDASTNNLMRIDTSQSAHHIFPASGMHREANIKTILVGETCADSVFSPALNLPAVQRGEPIVMLDAGMYAETTSNQFNGIPRPATVLVNGDEAEVIKERETVEDVFVKHRIPTRLLEKNKLRGEDK
jgi:diaminopimelate decarboxylase